MRRATILAALALAALPLSLRADPPAELELDARAAALDEDGARRLAEELREAVRPARGERVELVLRHSADEVVTPRAGGGHAPRVLEFPPDLVSRSKSGKRPSQAEPSGAGAAPRSLLEDQLLREAARLKSTAPAPAATPGAAAPTPGGRLHALPPAGGWKGGSGAAGAAGGSAGRGPGGSGAGHVAGGKGPGAGAGTGAGSGQGAGAGHGGVAGGAGAGGAGAGGAGAGGAGAGVGAGSGGSSKGGQKGPRR
jgi:hypothetical protein